MIEEEVSLSLDEVCELLAVYELFGADHLHLIEPVARAHCGSDDDVVIFNKTRLATLYAILVLSSGGHPAMVDWSRAFSEGHVDALKPIMDIYDSWQEHSLGIHGGDC